MPQHAFIPGWKRLSLLKATLAGVVAALVWPSLAAAALPEAVASQLRTASIPDEAVGAIAVRLRDGATIFSHRADQSMQPASTLKVLTSLVALEKLGPTYRGRVELRGEGRGHAALKDGVLPGNLVLRGMGSTDFDWEEFRRMLQSLRLQGVRQIDGDLLIDREWLQPSRPDLGLPPFDETPEFRYNVVPDALLLNTNLLQFDLQADGDTLRVRATPALDRVTLKAEMTLIDRRCADWEDGWKIPVVRRIGGIEGDSDGGDALEIQLRGEFPRNCGTTTNINVIDRADYVDRLFRALWRELGGDFRGMVREAGGADLGAAAVAKLWAEHRGRTLAEVVREINKKSDNPITRMVYLTLGKQIEPASAARETSAAAAADTSAAAAAATRDWLRQKGIDDTGLVLDNGSGLSRKERIRPQQLAAVLMAAHKSPWAPEFLASLPIVGVDGAMRRRLHETAALQRGRIKTGSLRDVAAIAGYVPDANGETCVIVAMINHPLAKGSVARPILDALTDWVTKSNVAR